MAFQVSPGVQVLEVDATSVVPAVSTSIGGFAGSFNWGPVAEVITVGSEDCKDSLNTLRSIVLMTSNQTSRKRKFCGS